MNDSGYRHVFRIPEKPYGVLLSTENVWGVEHDGIFLPLTIPEHCIALLPLLEVSCDHVMKLIREGLQAIDGDPHLAEQFPLDFVVTRALTWETDYWPSLAIQWIEGGYPMSDDHKAALRSIGMTNQHAQPLRQRARRLLKFADDPLKP